MSRATAQWTLFAILGSGGGCSPLSPTPPEPPITTQPQTQTTMESWSQAIRMVGRHRRVDDERIRYGWPGTGFTVRFEGTALVLHLEDEARYHAVIVDGGPASLLETRPEQHRYTVVEGLPDAEHEVTVLRRTEGHVGPTTLVGVEADGPLLPVPEPKAYIEVVGDSITAGYGNEGDGPDCGYTPQTQNLLGSYAGIAAQSVGAELSAVAWSGKGVVHNYGGDPREPLPEIYPRSVPTEPDSRWEFERSADVVLINLGTNDFSTDGDPTAEQFVSAYVELLALVRRSHPEARILATVAPLLKQADRSLVEGYIDQAITERQQAGEADVQRIELHVGARDFGCDWHPSAATHEAMAERLVPVLKEALQPL